MDIGEQQRVIIVEPLTVPDEFPIDDNCARQLYEFIHEQHATGSFLPTLAAFATRVESAGSRARSASRAMPGG